MKHIKILLVGVLGIIPLYTAPAMAQQSSAQVYATCGTAPYVAGQIRLNTQNTTGAGCITGTLSITPSSATNVGITPVVSASAESCHVLKASAGNLYSVSGYVGAAAWLMVFNTMTAPGDGAVTPTVWAYAPGAGSWAISYGSIPAVFSTGITVCASSTGPLTKTAYSTNTVFSGNVQ